MHIYGGLARALGYYINWLGMEFLKFIDSDKATKIQTLCQHYVEKCSTPFTILKLLQCNYLQMNREKRYPGQILDPSGHI